MAELKNGKLITSPCSVCDLTLMEKSTCCGCPPQLAYERMIRKQKESVDMSDEKPTIEKVFQIADELLSNDKLQASPSVWYGLHRIHKLIEEAGDGEPHE